MAAIKLTVGLNSDTLALFYLAEAYRVEVYTLALLYDKFGKDLFYFFFMLSGTNVVFPKPSRFTKIMAVSSKLMVPLTTTEDFEGILSDVDRKVLEAAKAALGADRSTLVFELPVGEGYNPLALDEAEKGPDDDADRDPEE